MLSYVQVLDFPLGCEGDKSIVINTYVKNQSLL